MLGGGGGGGVRAQHQCIALFKVKRVNANFLPYPHIHTRIYTLLFAYFVAKVEKNKIIIKLANLSENLQKLKNILTFDKGCRGGSEGRPAVQRLEHCKLVRAAKKQIAGVGR